MVLVKRGLVTIIRRSSTRFTFERVIRDEVQVGNLYGTSEADVSGCHSCRRKETRNRIISRICPFLPRVFLLSLHPSGRWLVGTVGIGPKVVLRLRKLLIFRSARFAQILKFAEVRYTPGTLPPVKSTNCAQIEATVMLSPPLLLGLAPIRVYGSKSCYSSNIARKGRRLTKTTVWGNSSHSAKSCLVGPFQFLRQPVSFDGAGIVGSLSPSVGTALSLDLLTD